MTSQSTSPHRPPLHPHGWYACTRTCFLSPRRAFGSGMARVATIARITRIIVAMQRSSRRSSPNTIKVILRWPCGTWTMSTAAISARATVTNPQPHFVTGSKSVTPLSMPSTSPGARPSGARPIVIGRRSIPRAAHRRPSILPSSSTGRAFARTPGWLASKSRK